MEIIIFILLLPFAIWLKGEIYNRNGYPNETHFGYGFIIRFIKKIFKK